MDCASQRYYTAHIDSEYWLCGLVSDSRSDFFVPDKPTKPPTPLLPPYFSYILLWPEQKAPFSFGFLDNCSKNVCCSMTTATSAGVAKLLLATMFRQQSRERVPIQILLNIATSVCSCVCVM